MTPEEIRGRDASLGIFWHLAPQFPPPFTEGRIPQASDAGVAAQPLTEAGRGGGMREATVAIKDNIHVAGMPTTAGFAPHTARTAEHDAPAIAALRRAGATLLGKVAMHEGALGATTDTPRLCHNPLRHGSTPGGSSGGSGAAVAAGFADLAIGTDTMGSVRIPAAYCGVVGLKPTAGLVSRTGVVPLSPTLDCVGTLARTPRLAARAVEEIAAEDPSDPASRPALRGWRAVPDAPVTIQGLRIGLPQAVVDAPMQPAILAAWNEAADRLRDLGAIVAAVPVPGWELGPTRRAGLLLVEAEAAALHEALLADPHAVSPAFRAALAYGRNAGAVRLARAGFRLAEARAAILRALDEQDALLMPTAPQRAFPHATPPPADQADFTAIANIAGLPALVLPWPAPDGDLPCSVQLLGHAYAESLLVGLAEVLLAA